MLCLLLIVHFMGNKKYCIDFARVNNYIEYEKDYETAVNLSVTYKFFG